MTEKIAIEPVRKTVTVPWSPEQAFDRFTRGISSWWPMASHSVGEKKTREVVFEENEGGRIFERWEDGTTSDWGTVLAFEEPSRLVFTWHPGRTPETQQRVEVTFEETSKGTRLSLVHSGWEELGEKAQETRDGYDQGWEGVLQRYVESS